jgi:hypothetical protein
MLHVRGVLSYEMDRVLLVRASGSTAEAEQIGAGVADNLLSMSGARPVERDV